MGRDEQSHRPILGRLVNLGAGGGDQQRKQLQRVVLVEDPDSRHPAILAVATRSCQQASGGERRQAGRLASAVASDRSRASRSTSDGTQSGKSSFTTRCAPLAVCSSRIAASLSIGKRSATRTMEDQTRRWTSVTFPFTSLVRTTSGDSARALIASKIA